MNKNLKHREEFKTDVDFIDILDDYCHQDGNVKPLSISISNRIKKLKELAKTKRQKFQDKNRT